jgi:hypothetical protein
MDTYTIDLHKSSNQYQSYQGQMTYDPASGSIYIYKMDNWVEIKEYNLEKAEKQRIRKQKIKNIINEEY